MIISNINLNTKFTLKLSLESIQAFEEQLKKYKEDIVDIAEEIVKEVSEEGLKGNYKSVVLKPIVYDGFSVVGGIETTEEKDTYKEFGTGIVGSNNPHVESFLAKAGWKYDINEHGEKGWIYPTEDGGYAWTKGQPAQKKFYEAMQRMEEELPKIASEKLK